MNKYVVTSEFIDLQDCEHYYAVGSTYPRDGYEPTQSRIDMLSSTSNVHKKALIVKQQESEPKEKKKRGRPDKNAKK